MDVSSDDSSSNEDEQLEHDNNVSMVEPVVSSSTLTTSNGDCCTKKENVESEPRSFVDDNEEIDAGRVCSICYSKYTTSGEHRLASLKCGHLFGQSCILRWLRIGCHSTARRCPACNSKALIREVRVLFAKNLEVEDRVERERLLDELHLVKTNSARLESQLKTANLKIRDQATRIAELECSLKTMVESGVQKPTKSKLGLIYKADVMVAFNLCPEGGCRVMVHSPRYDFLIASQSSTNPLFPGFGVRKINTYDMRPSIYLSLHKKPIRDMALCPRTDNLILTASADGCAKIFDVTTNQTILSTNVTQSLWACCWDGTNGNQFFCGSQLGAVFAFDVRRPNEILQMIQTDVSDRSPIISLGAVPSRPGRQMPNGGFLACRGSSIYTIYQSGDKYDWKKLQIEGNFMSMRYNHMNDHMLVSARPSSRWLTPRHIVGQLPEITARQATENVVPFDMLHTFHGTRGTSVLSRSSFVSFPNGDQLVSAFNPLVSSLDLWSVVSGRKSELNDSVYIGEPVLDMCTVAVDDKTLLMPCLSDRKISVVRFKFE